MTRALNSGDKMRQQSLRVCHMIYVFFLMFFRYNCAKFHHCRASRTDFNKRGFFHFGTNGNVPSIFYGNRSFLTYEFVYKVCMNI